MNETNVYTKDYEDSFLVNQGWSRESFADWLLNEMKRQDIVIKDLSREQLFMVT